MRGEPLARPAALTDAVGLKGLEMPLQMVAVPAEEFVRLRAKLPAVTADQIMAVYGISETTWRKIRKGAPVRRETLEKVRARYQRLTSVQ